MRIFKKSVIFVIANICVYMLFTTCFSAPSCTKILMSEAKNGNYDTLIMGESHAYAGVNPYIVSTNLNCEAMNISRPSTSTYNQYYMLKEVNKDNKYRTVIFDIDYSYWDRGHDGRARNDCNLQFYITGMRRFEYIKNVLLDSNYNDLIADYKISGFGDIKNIPHNLKLKSSKEYIENDPDIFADVAGLTQSGVYKYGGRGFYEGVDYMEDYYFSPLIWDGNSISKENNLVLKDMAEYCKENGVEFICISSALPPERLKTEDIDEYHSYFEKMCKDYGISYYDMNYARNLERTGKDYIDKEGHMMSCLADRQSKLLCEIIKSDDKNRYFYNSYESMLRDL